MLKVFANAEAAERDRDLDQHRTRLLMRGLARITRSFDGGSESRAEARAYHEQWSQSYQLPYRSTLCQIIIGGFVPRSTRGWRYVVSERRAYWMSWRKAKRLERK